MRRLVFAAALALAACASSSEVVPAGKDSYMVVGSAQGAPAAGQSILEATKKANDYCAKSGKFIVIRHTETGGSAGYGGEHSTLIFSCVTADDPEYQRPNLKKEPTTVIEDQRH